MISTSSSGFVTRGGMGDAEHSDRGRESGGGGSRRHNTFEERKEAGQLPPDLDASSTTRTIHLQFIPTDMTEGQLARLLEEVNGCDGVNVQAVSEGGPRLFTRVRICGNQRREHAWTYGFVEFVDVATARAAQKKWDGYKITDDARFKVNMAKSPIVDRLQSDAVAEHVARDSYTMRDYRVPPRDCSFGSGPVANRTIRDHITQTCRDDSVGIFNKEEPGGDLSRRERMRQRAAEGPSSGGAHSANATGPAVQRAVPGTVPSNDRLATTLAAAVGEGNQFVITRTMSHFFTAIRQAEEALVIAKSMTTTVASILAGNDATFATRLLLTALYAQHGSLKEALEHACDALRLLPMPTAVAQHKEATGTGHSLALLNHLVAFGLLLEPIHSIAARAFYAAAQHRAAQDKVPQSPSSATLDAALEHPVHVWTASAGNKSASFLRATFPLLLTEGSFGGYFFTHYARAPTFADACVSVYAKQTAVGPMEGSPR